MNLADIQKFINTDIPAIKCIPGCVECCTVALWTPGEWTALPDDKKSEVGLVKVPMQGPGGRRLTALLPVKPAQAISLAMQKKVAITEVVDTGLLLQSFGLDGIRCPFAKEGEGCTVYEYRPFICRIMGSDVQGRLHCPKGIECDNPLPDTIIMQRFLLWTNLFEPENGHKGCKK